MILQQNNYECAYEIMIFYNLFFSEDEDIFVFQNFDYKNDMINVYTQIIYGAQSFFEDYYYPFKNEKKDERLKDRIFRAACAKSFVHCAKKIKNTELPWGVMCGIRPAKNVRSLMDEGYDENEVKNILKNIYEVSDEKLKLACTVAKNEELLLSQIGKNSVSLYIGIPFCPTRCLYCSFVSADMRVSGKYMPEFVEKLLLEIEKTGEIIRKLSYVVENIYIGGGTPTTLDEDMLKAVLEKIRESFCMDNLREFTLEAGRVDTISEKKLEIAKKYGVNRISINPQTMNDKTLKKVRRAHNADMVREVYKTAKNIGFDVINMDLIAGLPGETPEMFKYSLDEIIKLNPENITVHSLCLKRAADLEKNRLAEAKVMNEMLSYTQKRMNETGRVPYYMYRQKNISGNLENVGYSYEGCMSAYNINIMEEKQTIIAMGGGGSSKLVLKDSIERIFNFKDPLEYIRRFDEILKKKDEILEVLLNG
ncbi:MAG: coproporphyrinogen dehydrogenase HemZ [Clostridiales bacterium]|nr:coproporphyrinogen dehydrogenase HemZ [Clostridiales bacterium]